MMFWIRSAAGAGAAGMILVSATTATAQGGTLLRADSLFNAGIAAYQLGDTATARQRFDAAVTAHADHYPSLRNLAVLQAGVGNYPVAAGIYERVLRQDMPADDRAMMVAGAISVGAGLFTDGQYREADQFFGEVLRIDPLNRDARYNQALSMYKSKDWPALIERALATLELDPLNQNLRIMLFNGYKGVYETATDSTERLANRTEALRVLNQADGIPMDVQIAFTTDSSVATINGVVKPVGPTAGLPRPAQLEIILTGFGQDVARTIVEVDYPPKGETRKFEKRIAVDGPVTSYRYRLLNGR